MLTIEIKRTRSSVTQGFAAVVINGQEVVTFGDDMFLDQGGGKFTNGFKTVENARHYGPVIGGWGSIKPDSAFIIGLIYHPYDQIYNHSEKFQKAVFAAD